MPIHHDHGIQRLPARGTSAICRHERQIPTCAEALLAAVVSDAGDGVGAGEENEVEAEILRRYVRELLDEGFVEG